MLQLILAGLFVLQPAPDPSGLLVVANKAEATASLIDVSNGTVLAVLPTGTGPHEAAISGNGRWAAITDYGDQRAGSSLTILDLRTRTVARTIDLGNWRRPHGVVFLPGDSLVSVTVEANQAVLIVNVARGAVAVEIPTDQRGSHMVAVTADGRTGFTANIGDGSISEVHLVHGVPGRRLAIAPAVEGIAVMPDGSQVWAGSNTNFTVTVVDVATWSPIDTLPGTSVPYRINITPDGTRAVVSYPNENIVRIYDTASRKELFAVRTPGPRPGGQAGPLGSTISADSRYAYVALVSQDAVAVVDLHAGTVLRYLATGRGPDGIAISAKLSP